MTRTFAVAALAFAACDLSWTFDDSAPAITLLGDAPSLDQFPKLNNNPVKQSYIVDGIDGYPWLTLCEVPLCNSVSKTWRVLPLVGPGTEETFGGDGVTLYINYFDFYTTFVDDRDTPTLPSTVAIRAAGEPDAKVFTHAPGNATIFIDDDPADPAYIWWIQSKTTTTYEVVHKNGMRFEAPLPKGADPTAALIQFTFLASGRVLLQDPMGDVRLRSMKDPTIDQDLGMFPPNPAFADDLDALVAVSPQAGVTVTRIGAPPITLDPTPASPSVLWLVHFGGNNYWCTSASCYAVYITVDGELRRTRLDGKEAPIVIRKGVKRLLDFVDGGREMWGAVDPNLYVGGVGDASIGDWHFMDRGWGAQVTTDGKSVLWVDDAAKPGNIGDLFTLALDSTDAPLELARNVRRFDQLGDGRLLAVDDHATNGVQSRVIVIDPKSKSARWVAPSANDYGFIPRSQDLLVDILTGASGVDVRRVPLPPAM